MRWQIRDRPCNGQSLVTIAGKGTRCCPWRRCQLRVLGSYHHQAGISRAAVPARRLGSDPEREDGAKGDPALPYPTLPSGFVTPDAKDTRPRALATPEAC